MANAVDKTASGAKFERVVSPSLWRPAYLRAVIGDVAGRHVRKWRAKRAGVSARGLIVSLPKAGTHLLAKALESFPVFYRVGHVDLTELARFSDRPETIDPA